MHKGDMLERDSSRVYHKEGTPALISSLILRSHNLGQIDIAYLKKTKSQTWVLFIIETKSSLYPSRIQMRRLLGTQDYLSRILGMESKLEVKFCQKDDPPLSF